MMRNLCLVFCLLLSFVYISFAEEATTINNETTNNTPLESLAKPPEQIDLHGIWRVSLANGDIITAINQSGDALFGLCKSEAENPWNGVIAGSVLGQEAHLAIAFNGEKLQTSIQLDGIANDDSMSGKYIRSDESGNAAKGNFTAIRISTRVSEFHPAKVENKDLVNSKPQAIQPSTELPFKDVRNLAKSINPNIMPPHAPL